MRILILSLVLFSFSGHAWAENIVSLNGFKLWQMKNAVVASLGEPFKKIETEYSVAEVYGGSSAGYMVFEYLKNMPHNVYSIQITGIVPEMREFSGLKLGDSAEKVIKVLGIPDEREKLNDPAVDVFHYKDANYSVETDSNGKLYSIRIGVTDAVMSKPDYEQDVWKEFSEAVLNGDIRTMLNAMRPDVEIYRNGKTLSIDRKFSEFEAKPDKEFVDALIGNENSLKLAIKQSKPTQEMRVAENIGVGKVYKFYDGEIVQEVVFFPYDGRYRVYEIAFKSGQDNQSM